MNEVKKPKKPLKFMFRLRIVLVSPRLSQSLRICA